MYEIQDSHGVTYGTYGSREEAERATETYPKGMMTVIDLSPPVGETGEGMASSTNA